MTCLTIRMDQQEKDKLMAWAAVKGTNATDYIKQLIAADMAAGSPQERAAAWFRENEAAISTEAEYLEDRGVPGAHLASRPTSLAERPSQHDQPCSPAR